MNIEKLWRAIGSIDPKFITEAETPPKKARRGRFGIVLAAAVLMLLSVSTIAAVKWYISLDDVFEEPPAVLKDEEQLIEKTAETDEPEEPVSVSVVSCLADERIFYLLWQAESKTAPFPEGAAAEPELSFGEASVNTSLGYYGEQIDKLCTESVIAGCLIADWNEAMQNAAGLFRIGRITAPKELEGEDFFPDLALAIEQSEYSEGEENTDPYFPWPDKYFPAYQFLDMEAYYGRYVDYAEYRDGKLLLVLRRPFGLDESLIRHNVYLMNSRTGEKVEMAHPVPLTFVDKTRNFFVYFIYEVDYEDIENLYFHSEGELVQSTYIKGPWEIPFEAEATLESVELLSAFPDVSIECSPISMAITGALPEKEYIRVTLSDGTNVSLMNYDYDRVVFRQPVKPEDIASVVINDVEYLKQPVS